MDPSRTPGVKVGRDNAERGRGNFNLFIIIHKMQQGGVRLGASCGGLQPRVHSSPWCLHYQARTPCLPLGDLPSVLTVAGMAHG